MQGLASGYPAPKFTSSFVGGVPWHLYNCITSETGQHVPLGARKSRGSELHHMKSLDTLIIFQQSSNLRRWLPERWILSAKATCKYRTGSTRPSFVISHRVSRSRDPIFIIGLRKGRNYNLLLTSHFSLLTSHFSLLTLTLTLITHSHFLSAKASISWLLSNFQAFSKSSWPQLPSISSTTSTGNSQQAPHAAPSSKKMAANPSNPTPTSNTSPTTSSATNH